MDGFEDMPSAKEVEEMFAVAGANGLEARVPSEARIITRDEFDEAMVLYFEYEQAMEAGDMRRRSGGGRGGGGGGGGSGGGASGAGRGARRAATVAFSGDVAGGHGNVDQRIRTAVNGYYV